MFRAPDFALYVESTRVSRTLFSVLRLIAVSVTTCVMSTLSQVSRVSIPHLDDEVLQPGVEESVEVCPDGLLDQVGVEAAGDHPDTDEGRQQGTGLEYRLLWERVDGEQTQQVTQRLWERQQGQQPDEYQGECGGGAVGEPGVQPVHGVLAEPDGAREEGENVDPGYESEALQVMFALTRN